MAALLSYRRYLLSAQRSARLTGLEGAASAQLYIRENYQKIVDARVEQHDLYNFVAACRDAANVAEHGRTLPRPRADGTRVERGVADAMAVYDREVARVRASSTEIITPLQAIERSEAYDLMPRLTTGVPALDAEGGFPCERFVVLGGAPGAGKTSFAVYLANRWMREGHPVFFAAVDEHDRGITPRLRALAGISRDDPDAAHLTRMALALLPFRICNDITVSSAALSLSRLAASLGIGKTPVLILDSLQTIMPSNALGAMASDKARIDSVIAEAKAAVSRHKMLVIATSELNRGAYKSKDVAQQSSDMASGMGTNSIEYKSETYLVMRNEKGSTDVDVSVAKNRGFRREDFRLSLDISTMSFRQVESPDAAAEGMSRRMADMKVLADLLRRGSLKNIREIREAMSLAGVGDRRRSDEALKAHLESGRVKKDAARGYFLDEPAVGAFEMVIQ